MALVLIVWMAWPSLYFAPAAQARVLRVPQDYPTIQKAVDAADPGDTIYVSAGVYYENVFINKPLSLIGECRSTTVIDGSAGGTGSAAVWVNASKVLICNFTIRMSTYYGIHLGPPEGSYYAWLKNISYCVISETSVTGGIKLNFCSHTIIMNSNISSITLLDSSDNLIIHNHINRGSIHISSGWRRMGFVSDRNIIAYNNITGSPWDGVFLSGSDSNVIFGNNITNNSGGGVRICNIYGVEHNYVYHNNFVNNTGYHASVMDYLTGNTWDDGYPSGGNYYDDYAGVDGDGDGIGDTPYRIPATIQEGNESNVDRYPLMNPYRPVCSMTIEPLKTIVGEGFTAPIKLALTNPSAETQTFNLAVQANALTIHTQNLTLHGGASANITLEWNTMGYAKGPYRIAVQATTVNGKRDTFYAFPLYIFLTIPGDINNDRQIDIYDVVLITSVYDAKKGDADYEPNKDINNDLIIDIYDVVICTSHYNQTW
jgi:parallel beta-helix repeat protein